MPCARTCSRAARSRAEEVDTPIGELRWRAPREVSWQGAREALGFGARCPQYASQLEATHEPGTVYGSEDCLTLSVWAPPHAEPERLPVMFWIHGGGNVQGGSDFYDGAALAVRQNVVVVSANYRRVAGRARTICYCGS